MRPTIGRIVLFKLRADDAVYIKHLRTNALGIPGQEHRVGNPVNEADVLPLIICRVWSDEFGPGLDGINGQVLLDGNDQYWVHSVGEGDKVGEWSWPVIQK